MMMNTMDAADAEDTNEALVKVVSQHVHLCACGFSESENDAVIQRLLHFVKLIIL
jgi:CDGSH-type Zn-finger protein